MRMVRQTAALICCHAASRGIVIEPALAREIALDVHVDIEVPLGYQYVNTEVLNIRAGPSEEAELLFQIQEGQRVEVWGRFDMLDEGVWCFVMWDDGEGWVSADYLGDCSSEAFHASLEVDTGLSLVSWLRKWWPTR